MEETKVEQQATEVPKDEKQYPSTMKVIPSMLSLYLVVFLIALDRTIVGTAVPSITKQFNSFGDIAWYEAAFLLPLSALQLSLGRIYKFYSGKWTLAILITVFEIGSIVSAAASSSDAFIVGRAISGIGGAGISNGAILQISNLVPLQARPKWTGGIGGVFGIASIIGPILGGYLTAVSWRWCFWINVPVGGIALALLLIFLPNTPPPDQKSKTWLGKLDDLDPIGLLLLIPCIICLLFPLVWGGIEYPWNDARIIAMLTLSGILAIAFVAVQAWRGEKATIPGRIFFQRSIFFGSIATLGIGSGLVLYAFYLPIWFQVIQNKSPQSSGLSLLPLLLSNVVAVIAGGLATSAFGFYVPFLMIGGAVWMVGGGLIATWTVNTAAGKWIGYQIIAGFGLGMVLQQPTVAAQTVLSESDAPVGISLLQFQSLLGGTIFVTVSQTLLQSKLASGLIHAIPDFNPVNLSNGAATSIRNVPAEQLPIVLNVYNDSIRSIWYLALGLAALAFIASFGMEWRSVKTEKQKKSDLP